MFNWIYDSIEQGQQQFFSKGNSDRWSSAYGTEHYVFSHFGLLKYNTWFC